MKRYSTKCVQLNKADYHVGLDELFILWVPGVAAPSYPFPGERGAVGHYSTNPCNWIKLTAMLVSMICLFYGSWGRGWEGSSGTLFNESVQIKLTAMLFSMTCLFYVSWGPGWVGSSGTPCRQCSPRSPDPATSCLNNVRDSYSDLMHNF
jgi:hypothetical protein